MAMSKKEAKEIISFLQDQNAKQAERIDWLEKRNGQLEVELDNYKDALNEAVERLDSEGVAVIRN